MIVRSLKNQARKLQKTNPQLFRLAQKTYHELQYCKGVLKSRLMTRQIGGGGKTKIEVPLARIKYGNFGADNQWSLPKDPGFQGIARVKGGDWDLARAELREVEMFRLASAYLEKGEEFGDSDIIGAQKVWAPANKEKYEDELRKYSAIYESIKKDGYKSQEELGGENPLDEMTVRIGRSGEILFENSFHRFVAANLLGVETVPVVVTVRHAKWVQIRNRFHQFAASRVAGRLYGKLLHPDLGDVPHLHECDDRVEKIEPHIAKLEKGPALDIGADLGIFSHMLERAGFEPTAVERDTELAHYIRLLRDIEGKTFDVITGDIMTDEIQDKVTGKRYALVNALNIFHHFVKDEATFKMLVKLLNNLDMEAMVFQAHDTGEEQMAGGFMNPEPDEFVKLILEHSCLNHSEHIGTADLDGRQIYMLRK
ncbi:MAG: hypothetical protein HKN82_12390 [Akkermansiaceae bacterium]|nr:hypothetical protein [Akkermansiaceae bacterium]